MSKKQKNETSAKAPVKLTRAEKKEIQAVIRKYKGDGKPHSAQASIPYEAMYQDGVCRVTPRTFSKCIEFTDISYQLAQADTKTAIFENLCDLYNYLDASIHVQFSFINRKIDPKQYAKSFEIRAQGDDFDDIRSEYLALLIVPPVALVLVFRQWLARHIRWTVALTALCDVLLFWDELFYYESFGLFAVLILVQLAATGAAAFRFYYKQRKG